MVVCVRASLQCLGRIVAETEKRLKIMNVYKNAPLLSPQDAAHTVDDVSDLIKPFV